MMETLPRLAPDSSRGERTRARCHVKLAVRRPRPEALNRPPSPKNVVVERFLLAGVCLVYLVSMAGNVLRIVARLRPP
jgi:hypothetical protein